MIPLVLRVALALLAVLLLMWLLAKAVRRPYVMRRHGPLAVLNRQQLGRGSAVAVVRVADRAFVLGVTEQQVNLLGEADIEAFETEPEEHRDHLEVEPDGLHAKVPGRHPSRLGERLEGSLLSPRTWGSTLEFLRERTTRR
ncbi:flagellar biosynthetic protein FliO [Actinoplanes sp. NPDC023801]|uniref:flagellar biosynthetic protein FliO n=1 Tax=Actinoplanes sp. NPDC023801 TaxID=3154595 RepID=UPI003407C4AA